MKLTHWAVPNYAAFRNRFEPGVRSASCSSTSEDGKEVVLNVLGRGEVFGEIALQSASPPGAVLPGGPPVRRQSTRVGHSDAEARLHSGNPAFRKPSTQCSPSTSFL